MFDIGKDGKVNIWKATDRAVSISQAAAINDLSEAAISKLVLSKDFPHRNGFPLAVLSVKVLL